MSDRIRYLFRIFSAALICSVISSNTAHPQDIARLQLDVPVEREIKDVEVQSFNIPLSAGQFFYIVADQSRGNIILTLVDPSGGKLVEMNSPNGVQSPESIGYIADEAGNYRIEVRSFRKDNIARRYGLRLSEIRQSTSDDKLFVDGQKLKIEGDLLSDERVAAAVEKYQAAANAFRLMGDKSKTASLLHQLGQIADDSLNKPDSAIYYYDEALEILNSLDARKDLVDVLIHKGIAYENLLKYDNAVATYEKALGIASSTGDTALEAKTLNQLGRGHARLGDFNQSLADFNRALKLQEGTPWTRQTSVTLLGLGNVYGALGNSARGLEYQLRNVGLLEENRAFSDLPAQFLNIGNFYGGQGNFELALEYYRRALSGFESSNAPVGRSYALANIGDMLVALGRYAEGLEYIERSRQMKAAFMPKDPGSLSDIARAYRLQGKLPEALDYYQKSLDIYLEIKSFDFAETVMQAMAEIYLLRHDYARTLDYAAKAIAIADRLDYARSWNAQAVAGYAKRALGQNKEARALLESAVTKIESGRSNSVAGEIESRAFEGMTRPYQALADIAISEGKTAEALSFAERSRARTLLDVLRSGRIDITKSMSDDERNEEKALRKNIAALNSQISSENENPRIQDLRNQLQTKRLELEDFRARLYVLHPELRAQRGEMIPVKAEAVRDLLPSPRSLILEFVIAAEKSFVFAITKDTGNKLLLKAYPLDIRSNDLAAKIESYRSRLASGALDFHKDSRALYDLLLKPAADELRGKTNVVIVPDGALWNLPFQALQDEQNRYLLERSAVSYAPSLTALQEMSKKAKAHRASTGFELIAFGNPVVGKSTADRVGHVFMNESLGPIPEAERLVAELGKMYGSARSKIYIGEAAREDTAKKESGKYRLLQFAAHGIFNDVSPMYSHIVMAQGPNNAEEDGLLEAWEMKDLDLNADLVILSACDTARGRISNGEGIVGMTWAMFIAGAPATIASQWKVESRSTTELMLEFHRQLLSNNDISKAEALRRASLKLLKTKFSHPSYWAAFVIVGDGS
jgi:CHAT domain-containing protein